MKLLVLLFSCSYITCFQIKTSLHYLFKEEPLKLEKTVVDLLYKHPFDADVEFISIPWSVLINKNILHTLPNIKSKKQAFSVCQHIYFKKIIPYLKKIGVSVLFTPHAEAKEINGVKIVSIPHLAVNGCSPASKKDILYSFIGSDNHPVRANIFKNLKSSNSKVIKKRKYWHFASANRRVQEIEKAEYQNIISRSRFSLCPRGTGPNTLRFWESLQAGAIPVLISDNMTLPKGFDWHECIIQVKEKDVKKIDKILSSITTEKEERMREKCLIAYSNFSLGENLISVIKNYYLDSSTY